MLEREFVIQRVMECAGWWLKQRAAKINAPEHGSMEVNPFLAPLICALHGLKSPKELFDFLAAGHFYIGHGTGFGKLVDEKILPRDFGTSKLDKKYRVENGFSDPAFDDIDHVIEKEDGLYLLSLKASKWTIQLGQAMGLNHAFQNLIAMRTRGEINFKKIIVGVFYGHADDLTDKYRILRGVTTGADHHVADVTDHVEVLAGRTFWAWLSNNADAQEWIMEGILQAINDQQNQTNSTLSANTLVTGTMSEIGNTKSRKDWVNFINKVNR